MKKNIFINLRSFLLLLAVLFMTVQCTTKEEKRYVSDETGNLEPKKKVNIVDKAAESYKLSYGYELGD